MDLSGFVHKRTKIKIGSETFTFTELNMADMAEFRAHVKTQRDTANEKRRARLLEDAKKVPNIDPVELLRLTDASITEEEFAMESETLEGVGYLAYLSLRHHNAEVSLRDVLDIITPQLLEEVTDAMFPPLPKEAGVKGKKKVKSKIVKSPKQQQ